MPKKIRKVDALKSVPMLWGCSAKELKSIAGILEEVDRPEGTVLMKEGAPGREMFIIASGKARVTRKGRTIASLGPGDVVGEMALLDGGPRTATVTADGPVSLLVVGQREFTSLLHDAPTVAIKMLRTLAERIRSAEPKTAH